MTIEMTKLRKMAWKSLLLLFLPIQAAYGSSLNAAASSSATMNEQLLRSTASRTEKIVPKIVTFVSSSSPTVSSKPIAFRANSQVQNTESPTISPKPSSGKLPHSTNDFQFRTVSSDSDKTPSVTPTSSPTISYAPHGFQKAGTEGSTRSSIPTTISPTSNTYLKTESPTTSATSTAVPSSNSITSPSYVLPTAATASFTNAPIAAEHDKHESLNSTNNLVGAFWQGEDSNSQVKESTTALTPTTIQRATINSQILMAFLGAFVTTIIFFSILGIRRRMKRLADAEQYTIYDATAGRHLTSQNSKTNNMAIDNNNSCSSPTVEQRITVLPDISNSGSSIQLSSLGTIYEQDCENKSDHSSTSIEQMFQFSLQLSEDMSVSTRNSWDGADYWSNNPNDVPSPFHPSEVPSPFKD